MNACKIFLLMTFAISEDFLNVSCFNPEMDFEIFYRNTKTIENTMNKIFKTLKLKKSFKKSKKTRLLLTMQKSLSSIIKYNYKNIDVDTTDNTAINLFLKRSIIDEILEEEYSLLFFSPGETFQKGNTFDDSLSEHLSEHLKKFLVKIDKITSQHRKNELPNKTLYNNKQKLDSTTISTRSERRSIPHQLKPWIPDADQVYAFNRRIYRSIYTSIKKYPFMASVHMSGQFVCAGSIISKELIITAASCLQIAYLHRNNRNYKNNITVRLGSDFPTQGGQSIPVSIIYFHPNYNPEDLKHNLAIMRMSKHKHFLKKNKIRRVLFDKRSDDLPNDVKRVTIVGWGAYNKLNDKHSPVLSLAHLDLYDIEDCKAIYSNLYVTDSNVCAGFISKGTGACNKDVGDPAVVAGVLIGVASFGPPLCGTPDAPTVFTRLGPYAHWIESILKMGPTATLTNNKPILRVESKLNRQGKSKLNRKGVKGLGQISLDLPEEFFILKEILMDIATSNGSEIKDVIDEGFDKEILSFIEPPHKTKLKNHPLVHKGMIGISGGNFPEDKTSRKDKHFTKRTTTTTVATTNAFAFTVPKEGLEDMDYNKLGEMFEVFNEQQLMSKKPPVITTQIKHVGRLGDREGSTLYNIDRLEATTPKIADDSSTDTSSGNYDGTDSDEEGMSIEVITKLMLRELIETTTLRPTTETVDYKNFFFILDNTVHVLYDQLDSSTKINDGHTKSHKIGRSGNIEKNYGRTKMYGSKSGGDDSTQENLIESGSEDSEGNSATANRYDVANRFTKTIVD